MVDLSVIMPMYNSSEYLNRTLKSTISFFGSSIDKGEILLIDDGSSDSTILIAKEFQKKHSQIRIVKTNHGGVSNARNIGIRKSRGKYITFFDSDDIFESNYFIKFKELINLNPDIVLTDMEMLSQEKIVETKNESEKLKMIKLILRGRGNMGVPSKFYNTQFIKENNIQFDKNIIIGEDMLFIMQAISSSNSICLSPSNYYVIPESHTLNSYHSGFLKSEIRLEKLVNGLLGLYDKNKNANEINYINSRIKINGLKNFIDCYYGPMYEENITSLEIIAKMLRDTVKKFHFDSIFYVKGFGNEMGRRFKICRFLMRNNQYKATILVNSLFINYKK